MALSQEQKRKINAALTECNGDRRRASELLGVSYQELKNTLRYSPDLKALWSKNPVPLTRAQIGRGPEAALTRLLLEESAEVRGEREEQEFSGLLADVGLRPEDVTVAVGLQKFYGKHIGRAMNLIGGGVTMRAVKLMKILDKLDARFEQGFAGENADAELSTWSYTWIEGHKQLARMLEVSTLSATARAKIRLYQSQVEGANGKNRGKAGFGPKTVDLKPA